MHQSKLITLLRTFTPQEHKEFKKFVRSPFFNTNENVVKLYDHLYKYAPGFDSPRLDRQKVFSFLFPDEPYKEIKIQQFASLLVNLIEQFWIHNDLKEPTPDATLRLADAYRQRRLTAYWQKTLSETDNLPPSDAAHAAYCLLQQQIQQHETIEAQEKREQEPHLQAVLNKLTGFFLVCYLKYGSKALNFRRFNPQQNYNMPLADAVVQYAAQPENAANPAIQIYLHIWRSLQQPDEETHFEGLKKLLLQHHRLFTRPEAEEMFVFAHNYCIGKLNKGQQRYLRELFDLYRFEMEQGIISPTEPLSASVYRNIITIAQLLGEWQWMEDFINNFRQAVGEDTYIFNLARLRFLQKRYTQTVELLQNRQDRFGDVLMLLAAKSLLLKALYELFLLDTEGISDYDDALETFIASFIALLQRRKKELLHHYVYYLNLTQKVRQLLTQQLSGRVKTRFLLALEQSVQKTTEIAEKAWLLEKITAAKTNAR
ncbi:hypothetical protein C7N43_19050 [Sphingobacteriales bacterium UPWRP_1]|nr:hypothetical protein BVG80_02910 [Sphingobacteriales bacterium TSM_CSM]PSJ75434.1 hypothetical protein C7N43_19050 [Sphingobacteriales bacterium UPWRP_1]